jgi:hypothetical protein
LADYGVEAQHAEALAQRRQRIAGVARAAVEHRRQQPHRECVFGPLGQQTDRFEEFLHAVKREVAELYRHDRFAGGAQCIHGQ